MEHTAAASETRLPMAPAQTAVRSYPPSWIDRFMAWVQNRPLPYGLAYLGLLVLEVVLMHILAWIDGNLPAFSFHRLYLLFPLWLWGPLFIMTYLDEVALHALRDFQPLLGDHQGEIPRLQYELTTLPARSVRLSSLIWSGVFVLLMYIGFPTVVRLYSYGPFGIASVWIFGLLTFVTGGAVYYHTIRQLRLVSQTIALVERVNLFRLDPIYAFARLTAKAGVSWLLLSGVTLIIFPFELINAVVIALYGTQVLFALGCFILPLWNVHQRLVAEKRRLLAEVNRRVEAAIQRLHQALDGDDLTRVKEVDTALAGLRTERAMLEDIATWPWSTAAVSGFVSALLLPIALFVIQMALRNLLGA